MKIYTFEIKTVPHIRIISADDVVKARKKLEKEMGSDFKLLEVEECKKS